MIGYVIVIAVFLVLQVWEVIHDVGHQDYESVDEAPEREEAA